METGNLNSKNTYKISPLFNILSLYTTLACLHVGYSFKHTLPYIDASVTEIQDLNSPGLISEDQLFHRLLPWKLLLFYAKVISRLGRLAPPLRVAPPL